jgi:hypothetical protein
MHSSCALTLKVELVIPSFLQAFYVSLPFVQVLVLVTCMSQFPLSAAATFFDIVVLPE